ncbi:NADPH-dependent FMN reductase [Alkalicoccus luteus]|uniref:NAD(P)H-dependent oxidoreductase n=1 Tax=Alkalicoccus luteus TaxID=1237094 RepID=A0A969PRK1_9BACI|nr:NAD(P)H-dependent oxidoreductase [Alkalicoccus luteus]NJP39125.1 NAD(P)H-dependent oxidoreductase [Alkalicoccus luteus]
MQTTVLVGSIRKESFNRKIADFMKERYADTFRMTMPELEKLPYFDQDTEETPSDEVAAFKQQIKDSDAVIIVTPEYNHSVPGMLKNALDWLSRVDKVLTGKPVLIVGASPGFLGTVRCQMHLRQILAAPGMSARVLPGNEVFIGGVHQKLGEDGSITDTGTVDFLDSVMKNFETFAKAEPAL